MGSGVELPDLPLVASAAYEHIIYAALGLG